jgi:hypothetical protein
VKKYLLLVFALALAGGVFAQEYTEYTIHYSGDTQGVVTVTKEPGGKIVIRTPGLISFRGTDAGVSIGRGSHLVDSYLCPLLPSKGPSFNPTKGRVIVIDGNTTTVTNADGFWNETIVDGNTITTRNANGAWSKAVVDGNTTTTTYSTGDIFITVVDGNTTTITTDSGYWSKTVVDGNTTTQTNSGGDTETRTVAGNTVTWISTSKDWQAKQVARKQGNSIFVEETHINSETLSASGRAHYNQKNYDQAIADFTEALRMNPGYAPAYIYRGDAYSAIGDYDRAIADFTQEIGLDPYYSLYAENYRVYAYVSRGNAYNRKGDRVRARADWSKALELDPNSTAARNNLEKFK